LCISKICNRENLNQQQKLNFMKTSNSNIKTASVVLITAITLFLSNIAQANAVDPIEKISNAVAEIEYAGKINNQPAFRLVIKSRDIEDYSIIIKEEDGEILFRERIKGSQISRTYKLDVEDLDRIIGTTFEITNRATNITTTYKINTLTSYTEYQVVAKN
jgi:HAMP domain-containing protein